MIVARHEVPGCHVERPRPGGTVEVVVGDICCRNGVAALETLGIPVEGMLASKLGRDPFNCPAGTRLFFACLQALRAWLRSCCPSGTKYILFVEALIKLALMGLKPWAQVYSPFGFGEKTSSSLSTYDTSFSIRIVVIVLQTGAPCG
jgi:hypothetical protein